MIQPSSASRLRQTQRSRLSSTLSSRLPLPPATLAGFALAFLAVLVITWISFRQLESTAVAAERVNHTVEVLSRLQAVMSTLKDAETGQRGYLLTGEAEFLATSDGKLSLLWIDGQLSQLVTSAAGIDVAKVLGTAVRGDRALIVRCGAAEFDVRKGIARPTLMLVDTDDSTIWGEGSLSLANETFDLRLRVTPKDFSLLSFRSPVRIEGTWADPVVSVEPSVFARRVIPAALLAMVMPLAAVLPLIETGDSGATAQANAACRDVVGRLKPAGS